MLEAIKKDLRVHANAEKARAHARFFKTGKGEYGEGDKFLGIVVPEVRSVAKKYAMDVDMATVEKLLSSPWHEERMVGLLMLVGRYERAIDGERRKSVYDFYISHTQGVNNWDLVDLSVYKIAGDYIYRNQGEFKTLRKWTTSKNVWERRMAIVAMYTFIRHEQLEPVFDIATKLLSDSHDLIHKAVGWMLREAGKKDKALLSAYLEEHATTMSRTTLRYAIEKYSPKERARYLKMK